MGERHEWKLLRMTSPCKVLDWGGSVDGERELNSLKLSFVWWPAYIPSS